MIRMFAIIVIPMVFLAAAGGFAAEPDLDGCNLLYHEGTYEEAIRCYEQIGTSAELLFNIGNSYAQLGRSGYAILHYLRALCLSPADADTLNNLDQIRRENSLFPPEPSLTDQFFSLLTISQWTYICLTALIFFLVLITLSLRKKRGAGMNISAVLICLIVFTLGAWGAQNHYRQWQRSVVVEETRLLISPFESAESAGAIEPGRLITPHKKYKEFVYVTDETGRKGWLEKKSQVPIIADSQ